MIKKYLRKTAVAVALAALAGPSLAVLDAVDLPPPPYTAATGFFPQWYRDTAGTTLDLCLSKSVIAPVTTTVPPILGGPGCSLLAGAAFDPALPVVFPLNFPDESFYFMADATVTGSGVDLNYIAHLEAAFAGGLALQGDQVTFARIRIVPRNLPAAGTWTITHPYGVEIIDVADPGRLPQITRDIGLAQGVFTGALQGDIGPFLTDAAGPFPGLDPVTGAPTGELFIGDPQTPRPVVGGPNGNNVVTVAGPGGITVTQNLFTLQGRIWNGAAPTPLLVDRSTYSRTAAGTKVDVFANASPTATVSFREALTATTEFPMTGDPVGNFYGQDPAAAAVPANVIVTATAGANVTPMSSPVVDVVKISRAEYVRATNTLRVHAASSDEVVRPTLTAVGQGTLVPAAGSNTQSLVKPGLPEPPAFVTVISSAGGTDTEPVQVLAVAPANAAPVAVNDFATTNEDVAVTLAVLANDTDPDLDPLTVTAVGAAGFGTATTNGATVTYTPGLNFVGVDTFTYTISDGNGNTASATVTVTVDGINDPPVAAPDTIATTEDTSVTVTAASLLANDTDPDSPLLTITAVGGAVNGAVALVGTNITFTPNRNFNGTGRFTYTVSDGAGGTATGVVTVTVTGVNDPPVFISTPVTTVTANQQYAYLATAVDPEAGVLTYSLVNPPAGMTIVPATGLILWVPTVPGTFPVTVQATDNGVPPQSATQTFNVVVNPPAVLVDLDISALRVTGTVGPGTPVAIALSVRNGGNTNAPRPATIVGTRNGVGVYRQTLNVNDPVGGAPTTFNFPAFTPNANQLGTINWTATIADDNPDVDQATATTRVR